MKKVIILISLTLFMVSGIMAQTSKRTSAYMYNKNKEYAKAQAAIDEAITHEKTVNDPKTWAYRGIIYFNIAISDDPEVQALSPNAATVSYESFEKAKELDTKGSMEGEIALYSSQLTNLFYQRGANDFQNANYTGAADNFIIAYNIAKSDGRFDTVAAFNIGMSGVYGEDTELTAKTMPYLKECVDNNFAEPRVYLFYSRSQKMTGDTASAFTTLDKGRNLFPEDQTLQLEQSQLYLETGENDKLVNSLLEAIAADPENANLYRVLGQTYENVGNQDKAIESYMKAIELDNAFTDAYFNLGAIYVNNASELYKEANNLDLSEQKKYDELKGQADANLDKAVPYLEKVMELNPDDPYAKAALKEAYANLGMMDKLKALNEQ